MARSRPVSLEVASQIVALLTDGRYPAASPAPAGKNGQLACGAEIIDISSPTHCQIIIK